MSISVDKVIDEERLVLRRATGKIEEIPVTLELKKSGRMFLVSLDRPDNKGYDCEVFDTLFFADRYFSKFEKKYGLKEG